LGRYELKSWDKHSAASDLIRLDRMSHQDPADLFQVLEDEAAEVRVDIVVVPGRVVEARVEGCKLVVLALEQQEMDAGKEQVGKSGFLLSASRQPEEFRVLRNSESEIHIERCAIGIDLARKVAEPFSCLVQK
jgi:hypothetical protein